MIDLELTNEIEIVSHEIDEDLLNVDEEPADQPKKGKGTWKPFFHSKDFWEKNPNKQLDHYVLGADQLLKLANKTAEHRQLFLDRAEAIDIESGDFLLDAEYDAMVQGRKVRSRGISKLKKEN